MIELPKLAYIETEPQVVPDLNNAKSLEPTLPVVYWYGNQVKIKDIVFKFLQLSDDKVCDSPQKRELKHSMLTIIRRIRKSHPEYFKSCLQV